VRRRVEANQHFAIARDDQIISVPFIDFQQNPDGIDGANGSQIGGGGFSVAEVRALATQLRFGELPLRLRLSGA
jgi:SecD/SecF fusion protein